MKISLSKTVDPASVIRIILVDKENPLQTLEESTIFSGDEKHILSQFINDTKFDDQSFCLWQIKAVIHGVEKFTPDSCRQAAGKISPVLKDYAPKKIALDSKALGAASTAAFAEALVLSQYKFTMFKEDDYKTSELILISDDSSLKETVERSVIAAESTNFARDIANAPGNHMTPEKLADKACAMADEFGLETLVFDEAKMKELGMNALLAVSAGSIHEARLISIKYTHPEAEKTIALVGKGLTFDAGGVSLKPPNKMSDMKYDKSGAAAVLGAIRTIAQLKPKINVVAVVPSSENVTGSAAFKPGDVITAYNGKTVEVINTDAEGRMILCDALAWTVEQHKPDKMINIATLTGASISSLGHGIAALMSNTEGLAQELIDAGKKSSEPAWELPIASVHHEVLKSDVADIKHTIDDREASLIIGAAYLSNFVGETPWCAMDIGATAWKFRGASYISRDCASGSCCRLLSNWVLDQV